MNNLKIVLLIACLSLSVIAIFVIAGTLSSINKTFQEGRLKKGEIDIFDYCSLIGDAAKDDPKCKSSILIFGQK